MKISAAKVAEFFRCKRKRWGIERTFSWLNRKGRRLLMRWERLVGLWEAFSKLGLIYIRGKDKILVFNTIVYF
ncbi:MAG: transposase [Simkaniaceae bacterium]|nr:transposase [Simkaniaceae bacterium]